MQPGSSNANQSRSRNPNLQEDHLQQSPRSAGHPIATRANTSNGIDPGGLPPHRQHLRWSQPRPRLEAANAFRAAEDDDGGEPTGKSVAPPSTGTTSEANRPTMRPRANNVHVSNASGGKTLRSQAKMAAHTSAALLSTRNPPVLRRSRRIAERAKAMKTVQPLRMVTASHRRKRGWRR